MSETDQFNSQSNVDLNQPDDNGLLLNNIYVPVELIQKILSYTDVETLLNCQQVCKSWNEITKEYVWRRKAEIKICCKIPSDTVLKWKDFYLIVTKNLFERNLIRNHSGEEDLKYWKILNGYFNTRYLYDEDSALDVISEDDSENEGHDRSNQDNRVDDFGYAANDNKNDTNNDFGEVIDLESDDDEMVPMIISDDDDEMIGPVIISDDDSEFDSNRGWIVESPPIGVPSLPDAPEFENRQHCFVTTYYQCDKQQDIDLRKMGFSRKILDHLQPSIEISEWYASRWDCGAVYQLKVSLLNRNGGILDSFTFDDTLREERQNIWFNVKHEFKNYGPNLRKIRFSHGGRDRQFWRGHYGSKMAGAYVKVKLPEQFRKLD